ncbi:cytochrome P450 6k1-like [Colias croceus]|uniref:cytochrome P450 6k1-like n=1 Tax=Colias crocea TaxID=72248 RepID=UPI001E28115E|nr:cytochrome P450 6k1-like [Colias croceus]
MILNLLGITLLCVVTWLYYRWTRVRQYWAKRGVPHLPPNPIMGSLTFLQRQNPGVWMVNIYKQFRSPYVGAWMFWRPALIINSPELARNILVKDSSFFRDRFLSSGSSDPIGSLNLFTVNDPLWSSIRRRLTSVFTASKLRALQSLVDLKSSQLVQRIKNAQDTSKLNIRMVYMDYTTDIIGTAAFGVETNATLTGVDPMRTVTQAFTSFDLYRGLCWSSIFFFPELVDKFRFTFFPKWSTDYFTKVFKIASKHRKNERPRGDLLDALLKLMDEGAKSNEGITEEVVIAQAAIFLFGGFESTSTMMTMSSYELAFHPDEQEKLYEELIAFQYESENGHLEISKLADCRYLNAVIKETLRKYSPMGWLDRIADRDYKIDENLTISAGTPVYVNNIGMQYDDELFYEAEKFIPERFLPENAGNIKPFTFLPFGEGPRSCIGKRFGQISMRHALANLILNYKLEALPGAKKPNEIKIEKRGLLLVPGEELYIKFIPRN